MRILLIAAVLVSTATAGELQHPNNQARHTYEQTKSQQAALREWERQRDEEMRKACEAYKNRLYKTPMNSRGTLCSRYWGE